jgi:hypothetical protein
MRSIALAFTLTLTAASAAPLLAFGDRAHQAVTDKAIDTLPKGLKPFYKSHRFEMPTLALEGDLPDEGPDRRFAIDRLMPYPFADVPRTEAALKERFPELAGPVGRLPWLVHESYAKLVEAFKAGDKVRILEESDRLAGLVTDLHNPLALTENADGQKTEQHGLWIRFGVKLPEAMGKDLGLNPDAAVFLDKPNEHVFSIINGTYVWLDNLLYEEELAHRGHGGYGERYFESFIHRGGRLLRDRLSFAAEEVGSYWYSAWQQAGRPELK